MVRRRRFTGVYGGGPVAPTPPARGSGWSLAAGSRHTQGTAGPRNSSAGGLPRKGQAIWHYASMKQHKHFVTV